MTLILMYKVLLKQLKCIKIIKRDNFSDGIDLLGLNWTVSLRLVLKPRMTYDFFYCDAFTGIGFE